jgi:putative component of toxin-antitoxin plasmid stabilization module
MGIHVQTHRLMGGIYEVRVEMGSGVMIYRPSFIKTGSGIRMLIWGYTYRHTD